MGLGRSFLRFLLLGSVSALLVTLLVRLWDEILGVRPREAQVDGETEADRTVLPGISIRS